MFDELKKSLEARWAWLTVAAGVVSGLVPEVQATAAESLGVVAQGVDNVRALVEGIGTQLALGWIVLGRKVKDAWENRG